MPLRRLIKFILQLKKKYVMNAVVLGKKQRTYNGMYGLGIKKEDITASI